MTAARKVKVFLSGEGPNELGSRFGHRSFQSDERPGVLHTLLLRVQASGWEVGGARQWTSIRKYRAGGAAHRDTSNVLGVALDAKEEGCDVLAFSRDVDSDPGRQDAIDEGIARVPETIRGAPPIIGGVAVPTLEGWILALLGVRETERLTPKRAEKDLVDRGVAPKDGRAMVHIAEGAVLADIPADAASLQTWLERAEAVLPPLVAQRSNG